MSHEIHAERPRVRWAPATVLVVLALVTGAVASIGGGPAGADSGENRRYVVHLNRDLLRHDPSPGQEDAWTALLDAGRPRLEITRPLTHTAEWNDEVVRSTYRSVLGREADPGGRGGWTVRLLRAGDTPHTLAVGLAASPESLRRSDGTPAGTVDVLYRALLGRAADPGGSAHFARRLADGASPRAVADTLNDSAEGRARRVQGLYRRLLDRSADPSGLAHWTGRLTALDDRDLAAHLVASDEYFRRAVDGDEVPSPTTTGSSTTSTPTTGNPTTSTVSTTTSTAPTTTTTSVPQHPAQELFTGSVEDFYVVPDPLPPGAPGTLIRYQPISADADRVNLRIMYHSRDAEDRDRAVTGTITYPTADAPEGGWPVVSYAHGTTGVAAPCAPSRGSGSAPRFGVNGVGVATDYIGLGPVGEIHPYLSSSAEGHAVIDAVRAARQVEGAHAGTEWFAVGASQGGHAAIVAGERNASYSPELTLLGTVALTPPAAFDQTFGAVDVLVTNIIGAMVIYGMPGEHPSIDPHDYASQQVIDSFPVLAEKCLAEIIPTFAAKDHGTFWTVDPRETEPARSFFLANEPGLIVTPAPMYIAAGTADIQVPIGRVDVLMERLCRLGQVVEYREIEGADHGAVPVIVDADVRRFLADRLAGTPPTSSC